MDKTSTPVRSPPLLLCVCACVHARARMHVHAAAAHLSFGCEGAAVAAAVLLLLLLLLCDGKPELTDCCCRVLACCVFVVFSGSPCQDGTSQSDSPGHGAMQQQAILCVLLHPSFGASFWEAEIWVVVLFLLFDPATVLFVNSAVFANKLDLIFKKLCKHT